MLRRITWWGAGVSTAVLLGWFSMAGADELRERAELHEPVYREAKATSSTTHAAVVESHPLDPAIDLAKQILQHVQTNINDYTCTMIKRETIDGELTDHIFMFCKVRNKKVENGQVVQPFSVYLRFLKPDTLKGQEVIYVAGQNDNKLIAHQGGWKGRLTPTVSLLPTSMLAMRGNKYPITELGIENLCKRLIERAEADRKFDCDVRILDGTRVGNRSCRCIEVTHRQAHKDLDFYQARVFIDDELRIPIRYEAYDWPRGDSQQPQLIEEYTYMNVKLNVGLTDADFSRDNQEYNF